MARIITFDKYGHDSLIDVIKAYAIICVLIGHTMPVDKMGYGLWAGMQVPLFILVQSFHVLKKPKASLNLKKLIVRIILPFFFVTAITFLVLLMNTKKPNELIVSGLVGGGYGPGAYFPWVYIQMTILLWLIHPAFNKGTLLKQGFIAVVICEFFELLCSITDMSPWLYRLLAIRYFFLIYLAWIWVRKGIVINKVTIILSLFSLLSILFFSYFPMDLEPLFYSTSWKSHRWPCYFYVSMFLCYVLYRFYMHLNNKVFHKIIKLLSRCSYEIFLLQMMAIALVPSLGDNYLYKGLKFLSIWLFSIYGGYLLNKYYMKFSKSIINNG